MTDDRPRERRAGITGDDGSTEQLESSLRHDFVDRGLLTAALTHSSLRRGRATIEFERLEFLGDRVLGLAIAELLVKRFVTESEGDLARRHSVLVERDAFAQVARGIELGRYLRLAPGEDRVGGRDNPAVLADALEAVIGALYLDGGMAAAIPFIAAAFAPLIESAERPPRDAKTALQEWAQARGRALPVYRARVVRGPAHRPLFEVEVTLEGLPPVAGQGQSKRAAEQAAAGALLAAATGQAPQP